MQILNFIRPIEPFIRPIRRHYSFLSRSVTIGVRALVLDSSDHILLVKHTYTSGWHLPGGGVARGEDLQVAIEREVLEEVGLKSNLPPKLISVHNNRGNYIVLYQLNIPAVYLHITNLEIEEAHWFSFDHLPLEIVDSAKFRLQEYLTGQTAASNW